MAGAAARPCVRGQRRNQVLLHAIAAWLAVGAAAAVDTCRLSAGAHPNGEETTTHICNSGSIRSALVELQTPQKKADQTVRIMAKLGLRTMLDVQLLADAPRETEELMTELGGNDVVLGHRAKVRSLLQLANQCPCRQASTTQVFEDGLPSAPRQLQAGGSSDAAMSLDTIAIVFSVLVGAAGYAMQ